MSLDSDRSTFSDFLAGLRSRVGARGLAYAGDDETDGADEGAAGASRVGLRRAAVALVLRGGTEGS